MKKVFLSIFSIVILFGLGDNVRAQSVTLFSPNVPSGDDLSTTSSAPGITLPLGYTAGSNQGYSNAEGVTPKLNYSRTWLPHMPVTNLQQGFTLNGTDSFSVYTTYVNGWSQTLQANRRGGA